MTEKPDGPEFEVWNLLEAGLQMAYDDMARQLQPGTMKFWQLLAKQLIAMRLQPMLSSDTSNIPDELLAFIPKISEADWSEVLLELRDRPIEGWSPWLRHVVDLEVATIGVGRASEGLERYGRISPRLVLHPIPEKASAYVAEVVQTYLMGFDAACIALCRACFEQIAKAVLVKAKVMTEGEIRSNQPTAATLLAKLKQSKLIASAVLPAERLSQRGNQIMHKGLYEKRILPALSLASIDELLEVSVELAPHW